MGDVVLAGILVNRIYAAACLTSSLVGARRGETFPASYSLRAPCAQLTIGKESAVSSSSWPSIAARRLSRVFCIKIFKKQIGEGNQLRISLLMKV